MSTITITPTVVNQIFNVVPGTQIVIINNRTINNITINLPDTVEQIICMISNINTVINNINNCRIIINYCVHELVLPINLEYLYVVNSCNIIVDAGKIYKLQKLYTLTENIDKIDVFKSPISTQVFPHLCSLTLVGSSLNILHNPAKKLNCSNTSIAILHITDKVRKIKAKSIGELHSTCTFLKIFDCQQYDKIIKQLPPIRYLVPYSNDKFPVATCCIINNSFKTVINNCCRRLIIRSLELHYVQALLAERIKFKKCVPYALYAPNLQELAFKCKSCKAYYDFTNYNIIKTINVIGIMPRRIIVADTITHYRINNSMRYSIDDVNSWVRITKIPGYVILNFIK